VSVMIKVSKKNLIIEEYMLRRLSFASRLEDQSKLKVMDRRGFEPRTSAILEYKICQGGDHARLIYRPTDIFSLLS
jgi:hypothetical protein